MTSLLACVLAFSASDPLRPSAAFPSYIWQTVPCETGALMVRQPVLPGRLGLVQDMGCGLEYLDIDGRRVRVQQLVNGRGELLKLAAWAIPLEWQKGQRYAGACLAGGCETLLLAVEDVAYPKSEITVAKKFAAPPPSEEKRIQADRVAIAKAFAVATFDDWNDPALCSWAQFEHPFVLPRPPVYTSLYGALRVINKTKHTRHLGTDFDGENGEPIVSAQDGTIVLAQDLYYSGNSVFVSHGFGMFTTYFHMTEIKVRPGDHVTAGQLLGTIGKTGRVTGPHLHFAAKLWGSYIDPIELFELDGWLDPLIP